MIRSLAVLGLGTMGGRAAARFATRVETVTGFDPRPDAGEAARSEGVSTRDTAHEAVADADVIVLSLPGPSEVRHVVHGALRSAPPGAVVVDLSTNDPDTARSMHAALASRNGTYVDAPVLGRPARCGKWTLPTGGSADDIEKVRPLLEGSIAERVIHVGGVGAGSVVKLLNNLMFGAINAVTAEIFTTCRRAGLDPHVLAAAVSESGAATVSPLFRELAAKIVEDDYSPTFELRLLSKDNRLALRLAHATGSPAFIAGCVDQLNAMASARWDKEDTASMYKLYSLLSGEDAT